MRIVYSESLSFVILYNPVTYSLEYQQDTDRYSRSGCLHYLKVVPCRSVQSGCLTLHATWCYRIHKIISVTWYYITLKWPHYHAPPISKVRENKRNLKWSMMEYVSGGYVYIMLWVVNLPGRLQISLRCEMYGNRWFYDIMLKQKGVQL